MLIAIATCAYTTASAQRHHDNRRQGYTKQTNRGHDGDNRKSYKISKKNYKVSKKQWNRGHNSRTNYVQHSRNAYVRHAGRPVVRHTRPVPAFRHGTPYWAARHRYQGNHHVYFRDYRTFYDPYRGGYVYWTNSRWVFSPTVPAFLAHVNLNTARIQLMADIPLGRHPEYYYDSYAEAYPRNGSISIGINLPL